MPMKSTSLKKNLASLAGILCMLSCSGDKSVGNNDDIKDISDVHKVELTRLDMFVDSYDELSDSARKAGLARFGDALGALVAMSGLGDSLTDGIMREYASGRVMTMFMPEIRNVFAPGADSLESRLGELSGRLAKKLPDVVMPHVYTVVSPYNQSVVFVNDTIMFLALNHYLGASHRAYTGFADYLRRLKEPERIPIDVAEALVATSNPYIEAARPTVLSRLLYEGAKVEAVMWIAGVDEATALGYDVTDMRWADDNERGAWRALLRRRMLFSTDAETAHRLVAPAPSTSILNTGSPGRLGRFIGHRIVARYLVEEPSATLGFLLSPEFYNDENTLRKSGYQN